MPKQNSNDISFNQYLEQLDTLFSKVGFERYLRECVLTYPSLYANNDPQLQELALLDQILNVNGNGLQSNASAAADYTKIFKHILKYTATQENELQLRFEELIEVGPILVMEGYTQKQLDQHEEFIKQFAPVRHSRKPNSVPAITISVKTYNRLKEEGRLPEEIVQWTPDALSSSHDLITRQYKRQFGKDVVAPEMLPKFTPYPNFSFRYSALYTSPLVSDLMIKNESWRNACIRYYEYCLQYFEDPAQYFAYNGAYVPNVNALSSCLAKALEKDFLDAFYKYGDNFEEISSAYGEFYDGDLISFLERKWEKNRKNILRFIKETLSLLKGQALNNPFETFKPNKDSEYA